MSDHPPLRNFEDKAYRDGYLQTQVRGGIAYQIRALREKDEMSQVEFAQATSKKQSTISRLENTEYGRVSVQTLLDIACARDVALVVKFVSYPEFFEQTADMSPEALQPETIHETVEKTYFRLQLQLLSDNDQTNVFRFAPKIDSASHSRRMNLNNLAETKFVVTANR